jgi:hypothetical protein
MLTLPQGATVVTPNERVTYRVLISPSNMLAIPAMVHAIAAGLMGVIIALLLIQQISAIATLPMHFLNYFFRILIMKIAHFSVVALPFMLLAACGSQAPQSVADQQAQLCTDLARLNTSVATLKSMSPSSTVNDFRAARDEVKANFEQVKLTAQNVQEAKVAELETAYQNLDKAIQDVPESATLQQAMDSVSEQIAAVEMARDQMNVDLNCP